MAKGGYQIIDLSKDPFISGTAHTVHGAFKKATLLNGHKPIMLEGIQLAASTLTASTLTPSDLTTLNAEWVNFSGNSSAVSTTLSDNTTVAITSADAVTVTAAS